MSALNAHEPNNQPFDALNPDLPFLAANAALELDNILNNTGSSLSYVEKLERMLESSAREQKIAGGRARLLVDPVSSNILSRALAASHQSDPGTLQDLAKAISVLSGYIKLLRASNLAKDNIASLRDFCVALSTYASASRKTIYGKEPAHQFRR